MIKKNVTAAVPVQMPAMKEGHILDVYYKDIEERTESYRSVTTERMTQICREVFAQSNILLTIKGKKKKVDKERLSKILCTLD